MRYRLIYIGLGLVGLAAISLGILFAAEGETLELPRPLEAISPLPGDLVPRQTTLEVDLEVGYRGEIVVDGWPISDLVFVEGTGVYRWSPSPSSPTIQEWTPGSHTVVIRWDTITGLPDPGSFEWSFRVG